MSLTPSSSSPSPSSFPQSHFHSVLHPAQSPIKPFHTPSDSLIPTLPNSSSPGFPAPIIPNQVPPSPSSSPIPPLLTLSAPSSPYNLTVPQPPHLIFPPPSYPKLTPNIHHEQPTRQPIILPKLQMAPLGFVLEGEGGKGKGID